MNIQNHYPLLSVVIPVYNEEENIPELYRRLTAVLEKLCEEEKRSETDYEIILIDDGSIDNSWQLIRGLHQKDPRLKGISFSRNFGHHIALTAGLDHAEGEAVILMDSDLQDPPEEIPKFYSKFKEGYETVYALRDKKAEPALKKIVSWIYMKMLKNISNVDVNINSGIFRIMSRRCVQDIRRMKEKSRFITGLISWLGYSHTGVMTERHERYAGKSKYSFLKLLTLAWHGITAFSRIPLQAATYFGFLAACISFLYGVYLIARKLVYGIPVMGYTSIMASLFFLGGVILFVLGTIGEYIGRIYEQVQDRPLYLVKERLK